MLIEKCLYEHTDAACLREVQRTLDESVKKLLEEKIQALGVGEYFEVQHNRILAPHGGRIIFLGMQDANAQNIKSLEGFDIAWFEESQTMSPRSLELLRPTIRKRGSELWFSWNPLHEDDAIDQFLRSDNPPPNSVVIEANWRDNPWFPPELEAERRLDLERFPRRYRHIWEGDYSLDGDAFFTLDKLLVEGKGMPIDGIQVDQIFATVDTASKDGAQHDGTACVIWARNKYVGTPLIVLDWDVVQIEASLLIHWLPSIVQRMESYAKTLRAREGTVGIWIEDKDSGIALLQSAKRQGLPVQPIDTKLTSAGKEGRALIASPYVFQDQVKLSQPAYDKTVDYRGVTKNHFLDQLLGFRMGDKKASIHRLDIVDCFSYGVSLALGNTRGY
jgi:phage terminase large subunit-like protein